MTRWHRSSLVFAVFAVALASVRTEDDGELCGTEPTPACAGADPVFQESFDDGTWTERWTLVNRGKYNGQWSVEVPEKYHAKGDRVLRASTSHKHHGIYAKLAQPFETAHGLFFQYEVKYLESKKVDCAGAYVKLLQHPFTNAEDFSDAPFSIMFGPDYCGPTNDKVHFIFRVADGVTGKFVEHHLVDPPKVKRDDVSHVYALKLSPDDSFEIHIDGDRVKLGRLDEDFEPPLNPPTEIVDSKDTKPEDWDDREEIADPDVEKPEDWDEFAPYHIPDPMDKMPKDWDESAPRFIPDETAAPPPEWDVKEDGEWTPPEIVNPKCETGCGKWKAKKIRNPEYMGLFEPPLIPNPNYSGEWTPRIIPNPDYHVNPSPTSGMNIDAIAIEIWVTTDVVTFDNFFLSTDGDARALAASTTARAAVQLEQQRADAPKQPEGVHPAESIDYIEEAGLFVEDNPALAGGIALVVVVLVWYAMTSGGSNKKKRE